VSWAFFWLLAFGVAFFSFVLISLAIAVRGVGEIRELFTALEEERRRRPS
jgi:Na+-transporting methylmalonyl-CoA/oxaloacetate decarboxylase gamma subunit